jgi:hypothetical protein
MVIRRNWADSITVRSDGDSLLLTGTRLGVPEIDLFDEGYAKTKTQKGSEPLYMDFSRLSNAKQVAVIAGRYGAFYGQLTEYFYSYLGPTYEEVRAKIAEAGNTKSGIEAEYPSSELVVVKQPNSLALQEASALRAVLSLLEASRWEDIWDDLSAGERKQEYKAIQGHLCVLAEQTREWPNQLATEKKARRQHELDPNTGWSWTSIEQELLETAILRFSWLAAVPDVRLDVAEACVVRPHSALRLVVTTILNAFPPLLTWNSSGMAQHSGADLIFGIRPLIYHMVREDLLSGNEIRLCRNKSCGQFFRAERRDQTCCTPDCSERVRYQKYYENKRKPARQAARAARSR